MTASSVGDSSIPVHPGQRGETRRPGTTAFTRTRAAGARRGRAALGGRTRNRDLACRGLPLGIGQCPRAWPAGACLSRRRYRRGRPGCRAPASRRVRPPRAVRQEAAGGGAAGRTAGTGVRNRALKACTRPLPWVRCRL